MKLNYLIIPAIVFGVAALGSLLTSIGIDSGWYSGLIKPDWIPPGNIIGTVWTGIYALVTISLWVLWNRAAHDDRLKHLMEAFAFNALLNVAWSFLFFVRHQMNLSLIIAVLMWFSVIELMYSAWPVKKIVTFLLLPYAFWLIVASVMNYIIWRAN